MDGVERLLRARGVELVDAREVADLVVVNTCTVTSIADRKSRQAVRRARRTNPEARVLVTGCSVVVDPEALAAADPMARLYDNESKARLLDELAGLLGPEDGRPMPTLSGVEPAVEPSSGRAGEREAEPEVEGAPDRAVQPRLSRSFEPEPNEGSAEDDFAGSADIDRTRAFVKIQDGCSFHCTYCIIPRARGSERSIPADEVLAEVNRAVAAGHREVVLTGINAGTYQDAGLALPSLVRRILAETRVERIRLSSIEPQHVTDELLDAWIGSGGRCLPHFHIPLQSGDDTVLRRMGRRYDAAFYAETVRRVRRAIPGVAVHADVIAGFPGEDDAAWARTMAFLRSVDLAGVHVFRYSSRPGTPAARMVGQVDARTKKRRAAEALALAAEARASFAARHLGRELRVLFEQPLPGVRWLGPADTYVLVVVAPPAGSGSLENEIGLVRAESIDPTAPDRLVGRLLSIRQSEVPLAESPLK